VSPLTSEQRASRVAIITASAAALIGALGVAARVTGAPLLPVWPAGSSSIALWVAAAILLLGVGLLATVLRPNRPAVRPAASAIAFLVLAASLATLVAQGTGSSFDIEGLALIRALSRVPMVEGRSSTPLGIPSLICGALSLLFLATGRGRSLVGGLALVPLVIGLAVCLGFIYQLPLIRAPTWRPVSWTAGLSAVFLATGLISAAGPTVWPLRTITGPSVRSQLFRWFMPLTVLIVVLTDLLTVNLFSTFSPALGSVVNTLVSVAAAAVVTYYVARVIGGRLDRAERERAESEAQFRALIENSSDLITITDATGVIRYQSPSHQAILGFEPRERLGVNIRDLIHADDMDRVQHAIDLTLTPDGPAEPVLCRLRHKAGTWRLVESVASNMLSVRGVAGFVIHSRDVTDRQKLEEQLRQSQKMETVGQLAGGIAHDFNNMLSVIMANTDLIAATLPAGSGETVEELRDMRGAAERGTAMVRQLMSFSRVSALDLRATDIGALAERVGGMLRRMLPANVAVEVGAGPELLCMVDPGAVEQMVLNLATNARDAMPRGGRLEIGVRRAEPADLTTADAGRVKAEAYVCLAVTDTGTGMDAATLQRVFEPFFTTKPLGKGTGLGMAMVHGLMNQHGGYVHVTSQPGQGTSVRLCFQVATATAPAQEVRRADPRLLRGSETVLVVEDEAALRRAAQRILERHGYRVLTAPDGDAALLVLAEPGRTVDLILTDMMMPRSGGADLYHRVIQEIGPRRFLVASGYNASEATGDQGLPAAVPFIKKPWTLEEILGAVRKALDAPLSGAA